MTYVSRRDNVFGPIIWLLIIFGVLWAAKEWDVHSELGISSSNQTARDILDERYARGEIDEEEYREHKKILRKE
jgi:putative membrane protein